MTTKELIISSHHTTIIFERHAYQDAFNRIIMAFQKANNAVNPDYAQVMSEVSQLQDRLIEYEGTNHFLFDNNPFYILMDVDAYVGIGALENLKKMINANPSEAEKLIGTAPNKLKVCFETARQLNGSFKKIPGYQDALSLYTTEENQVIVRFVLPEKDNSILADTAKNFDDLEDTLKSIGRLDKQSNYAFEIRAISHSSPEVVLLVVSAKVAVALNIIVKTILKRWKEIEEIRNLRAQTEQIKAATNSAKSSKENILSELNKIEKENKSSTATLADDLYSRFENEAENIDGAPNEVKKALKGSIQHIESLVVNGGNVNVYLQAGQLGTEGQEEQKQQLIANRQLQAKLSKPQKMLESNE